MKEKGPWRRRTPTASVMYNRESWRGGWGFWRLGGLEGLLVILLGVEVGCGEGIVEEIFFFF